MRCGHCQNWQISRAKPGRRRRGLHDLAPGRASSTWRSKYGCLGRRVHLQRAGHLDRVRAATSRARAARSRPLHRHGHERLHHRRGARPRSAPLHRRVARGRQGLHGRDVPAPVQGAAREAGPRAGRARQEALAHARRGGHQRHPRRSTTTRSTLRGIARWIATRSGADTPWHVTRFFPYLELVAPAADAARDAAPRARDRPRGGPRVRLPRQRGRGGRRGHHLPRLRDGRGAPRRLPRSSRSTCARAPARAAASPWATGSARIADARTRAGRAASAASPLDPPARGGFAASWRSSTTRARSATSTTCGSSGWPPSTASTSCRSRSSCAPTCPTEGISAVEYGLAHSERVEELPRGARRARASRITVPDLIPKTHLAMVLGEVARDAGAETHAADARGDLRGVLRRRPRHRAARRAAGRRARVRARRGRRASARGTTGDVRGAAGGLQGPSGTSSA